MSGQETVQKEGSEESKDLPCVFGEEIHPNCPVRKEIGKRENIDLKKWIKPKVKIFEEADELVTRFTEALNYDFNTLSDFCGVCPYLNIYEAKHT